MKNYLSKAFEIFMLSLPVVFLITCLCALALSYIEPHYLDVMDEKINKMYGNMEVLNDRVDNFSDILFYDQKSRHK